MSGPLAAPILAGDAGRAGAPVERLSASLGQDG